MNQFSGRPEPDLGDPCHCRQLAGAGQTVEDRKYKESLQVDGRDAWED